MNVLLWQMCSRAQPWAGLHHAAVVAAVVHQGRALTWPGRAPPQLAQLGAACIAADPKARPGGRELTGQLEQLLAAVQQAGQLPATEVPAPAAVRDVPCGGATSSMESAAAPVNAPAPALPAAGDDDAAGVDTEPETARVDSARQQGSPRGVSQGKAGLPFSIFLSTSSNANAAQA
jgi:hypothetical protein